MTVDHEIVEAVQRNILDPKGYAQLARNDIALVIEAYHAVMRERREEVVAEIYDHFNGQDDVSNVTLAHSAFNAIFGDEQ